MVQFLSIFFFSWISSIFVGFFKSSRFFVSPCICANQALIHHYMNMNNKLFNRNVNNFSLKNANTLSFWIWPTFMAEIIRQVKYYSKALFCV